jgi:hypothetical protein
MFLTFFSIMADYCLLFKLPLALGNASYFGVRHLLLRFLLAVFSTRKFNVKFRLCGGVMFTGEARCNNGFLFYLNEASWFKTVVT